MNRSARFLAAAATLLFPALLGACTFATSGPRVSISDERETDRDGFSIAPTTAKGTVRGRQVLGDPIPLPRTSTLLIPFMVQSEKGLFDDGDPFANSGGTQTRGRILSLQDAHLTRNPRTADRFRSRVRWHNAFFRDTETGEDWMLLDERGVISLTQSFPDDQSTALMNEGLVAFVATLDDTNNDGTLDNRDARVLILTDDDGRNPRVVSPRDAQVLSFTYRPQTNTLWLEVLRDADGDLAFKPDDDRLPYLCTPSTGEPATPVIALDTIERARALLRESEELSLSE
ncbi:MAG: hypothetical protein AAFO89_08520 [Planctomycetota bacterium]